MSSTNLSSLQIAAHDADLRSQAAQLRVVRAGWPRRQLRPAGRTSQVRIHDHDAWLIAQDREQSELVRDLAELRLLLVQMNRLLLDLNERVQSPGSHATAGRTRNAPHDAARAA